MPDGSRPSRINLGCGRRKREGYHNVDHDHRLGPDQVVDLFAFPWPFETESVDELLAEHVVEHIPHHIPGVKGDGFFAFMREAQRVLKPNGIFVVRVPSWRNREYAETDPSHTRIVWPRTWEYIDAPRQGGSYLEADAIAFELVRHETSAYEARGNRRLLIRGLGLTTHLMVRMPFLAPLLRRPAEETFILRKRDPRERPPLFPHVASCCGTSKA